MPLLRLPPATVRTWDGLDLVLRHWPAPVAHGGRIHLVHGLGEHVGRYEHVAAHLNALGWDVTAHDQRGHGTSPGTRGALRAADDLIEDLGAVLGAVRPAGGPLVLLGHSMGGLVAAQFVAAKRGPVDALVLSSPALDAALGPLQKLQLTLGLALVPDQPMGNQLDATKISHDPEVVRKYLADPLVHDRITARLAKALLDGGSFVRSRAAGWTVPTLLLWAGSDRLVSPAGSASFAAAAPGSVVTARCFDDLYHEILNERDASPVFAALDAWLGAWLDAWRGARLGTHPGGI